ncbi:MAG: ROK family glucokinase [Phycisphaerales bacterium]|nr:MAG: ROK family glucokinase [Phycisphaerales bacterium]
MARQYAIGVDLGGTTVRIALVNHEGHVRHAESYRSQATRGPEPLMDDMAAWILEVIDAGRATRDDVVGVGIGSPGPLSPSRGIVFKAANLPGWVNVPLCRAMRERTGLPTVMDNDGNLAAFGEYWAGAGKGVENIVMLTLGTGIGAGVVVNGELLHGHFENAGELGHTIVVPDGRRCSCGQRGCLEQYASAANVGKRVAEAIRNGEPSRLAGLVEEGVTFGSRKVVEAAGEGDVLAARIWDEACYYLAIACVNIQHAYNPSRIVMAGGMSKAGAFLVEAVRRHFKLLTWDLHDDSPDIRIAVLGDDAGVIGAAGWAWKAEDEGRWDQPPGF